MDARTKLLHALSGPIEAAALLVPNAQTAHAFSAREIGHFRRLGANSWDPSEFVLEEGKVVRIFPAVKVHAEGDLGWFRMRYKGGVHLFEWQPEPDQAPDPETLQARFVETCLSGFHNAGGIGAMAFIARKLDG